jgi:hypothetical protein
MLVELITSFVLMNDPPGDELGLAVTGAVLAAATWALTALGAAPAHGRIGREGLNPELQRRLIRISWVRTIAWTAHAGVVIALLSTAIN